MQSKCCYIILSFQGKKETPTKVFSCGICETFKNSCGCFWKQVTYYMKKSYIGHKFADIVFLLNCIYCWPDDETWNLSMMWCEQTKNEQAAETCAWNENKYFSCCIILIRIDIILLTRWVPITCIHVLRSFTEARPRVYTFGEKGL